MTDPSSGSRLIEKEDSDCDRNSCSRPCAWSQMKRSFFKPINSNMTKVMWILIFLYNYNLVIIDQLFPLYNSDG